MKWLTLDEYKRVLDKIEDDKDKVLIRYIVERGKRVNEVYTYLLKGADKYYLNMLYRDSAVRAGIPKNKHQLSTLRNTYLYHKYQSISDAFIYSGGSEFKNVRLETILEVLENQK